jgi:hypothetical protein
MSTSQLARQLRCSTGRLIYLVGRRRIPPPGKNQHGDYVWSPADVERAVAALATIRLGRPFVKSPERGLAHAI